MFSLIEKQFENHEIFFEIVPSLMICCCCVCVCVCVFEGGGGGGVLEYLTGFCSPVPDTNTHF